MPVLAHLADYVCAAVATELGAQRQAILRDHISDCAIALIAGTHSPEGKELAAICSPDSRNEAIATATAIIRSTEVDDIHLGSCVTPSSVTVPAALFLAAQASARDVENAVLVGNETMVRLGLAIDGPTILYRGIWPTCIAAPLGVAAVAARLWNLDREQTSHALSLALMMSAGRTSRFAGTPSGRWILIKSAVVAGIEAANAARAGYKGDPAMLDGDWMERAQGIAIQTEHLAATSSSSQALAGLSLKPFSTARQALGPTQALMDLIEEGLDPRSIQSIKVRVPPAYAGMISQPINPDVRGTGYVSVRFQMALAALRPIHLWDLDRSTIMHDAGILDFADNITVEPSDELKALYPACWPGEIEVTTQSGLHSRKVTQVRGDADLSLTQDERQTKTLNLLTPALGAEKATAIWDTARGAFESDTAIADLRNLADQAIKTAP